MPSSNTPNGFTRLGCRILPKPVDPFFRRVWMAVSEMRPLLRDR